MLFNINNTKKDDTQPMASQGPIGVVISGKLYLFAIPSEDSSVASDIPLGNYPLKYKTRKEAAAAYDNWSTDQLMEMNNGASCGFSEEEELLYILPELSAKDMAMIKNGMIAIKNREYRQQHPKCR